MMAGRVLLITEVMVTALFVSGPLYFSRPRQGNTNNNGPCSLPKYCSDEMSESSYTHNKLFYNKSNHKFIA